MLLIYSVMFWLNKWLQSSLGNTKQWLNQFIWITLTLYIFFISSNPIILSVRKKVPLYFRLWLSHILVDFYNFYNNGNRSEYSRITCNLLTHWLDDVITVTRHISQQFNFSLRVKMNRIQFEDNFLVNPWECNRFSVRRSLNEFSNK